MQTIDIVSPLFRYPGTTFTDHIYRYESDPDAKIIVLLGEVMLNVSCRTSVAMT